MMKRIHILSVLIGVVGIAVLVYFALRPRDLDPVTIYKTTAIDAPKNADPGARPDVASRNDGDWRSDVPQQQGVQGKPPVSEVSFQDRLEAAKASPAYAEYKRKQSERMGFNIVLYWEFLEASGIRHNGRILQAEAFEKHFPDGGSYTDYEPMMRLAVAEMFLEDPDQSVTDVLQRFNAEQPNRVWRFGHFNGYEGEYDWGKRIQRDAETIVANAAHQDVPFEWSAPSVSESLEPEDISRLAPEDISTDTTEAMPSREMPSVPPVELPVPESFEELERQFMTQFLERFETGLLTLPTDTGFENLLQKRFSADRSGSAAETLRQYGPEEGMRRLRASDPEVATEIERVLRREPIPQ